MSQRTDETADHQHERLGYPGGPHVSEVDDPLWRPAQLGKQAADDLLGVGIVARMGEKWVALILKELAEGPRRYGELARTIAGASQKMLTQTLRRLERDGLLSRTVTPAVPVRVDYALTPLGQSLVPVLQAVTRWAEQNIEQIDVAREAHDAQQH